MSTIDTRAAIERIYFTTTRQTIRRDLARAIELLKSLPTEAERERATPYMNGLLEMCAEWGVPTRERAGRGRSNRRKR